MNNTGDLIELKINRTKEGICIYAKSPILAEWIKSQASFKDCEKDLTNEEKWNIVHEGGWGQHIGYKIPKRRLLECLGAWGSNRLMVKDEKVPNLAFLKARGLENGVTFNLQGLYSADSLNQYRNDARDMIIRIYRAYLKEVNTKLLITVIDDV